MKMKEFGPGGGASLAAPLRSANVAITSIHVYRMSLEVGIEDRGMSEEIAAQILVVVPNNEIKRNRNFKSTYHCYWFRKLQRDLPVSLQV